MLYFFQIFIMVVIVGWLLKTKRVSWNSFWTIFTIALITVDIIEIFINLIFNLYKFPTNILSDPDKDNFLGILCADSIILPLTAILFCYCVKSHPFKTSIIFTIVYTFLEWIYLKLEYLIYLNWKLHYSALAYIIGFSFFSKYANKLIDRPYKVPYYISITCFAYFILVIPGAIPDVLLNMYNFRPGLVQDFWVDDRISDLGSCLVIANIVGFIIPRVPVKYKKLSFIVLAILSVSFGLISYFNGWLIYNKWNHFLTIIRYCFPFLILYFYDKWQIKLRYT